MEAASGAKQEESKRDRVIAHVSPSLRPSGVCSFICMVWPGRFCLKDTRDSTPLVSPNPTSPHQALSKMDKTDRAGRREQLKRTAFWLPEFQPETKDTGIAKVGR